MKIAFVNTSIILCGGIITNYEYVKELKKRGYEAFLCAESGNEQLENTYGIAHCGLELLETFTSEDVIIANRWEQCEILERFEGRKYQYVQGKDIEFYKDHTDVPKLIEARNNPNWELIGVSPYALQDWGRGTVILNGISSRFFVNHGLERNIDALIEGNDEPNKNIDYAIAKAKEDGHNKIVWLGRETHPIEGIECITNPPQEEIPKIYQRAKHFYKYSKSEGFCLPIVEAKASGCIIHTWDQGHNFPEDFDPKEYTWEKAGDKLLEIIG